MNTKFDELTKGLAQSVTRRGALKQFGLGLAGLALACFGLADKAHAGDCENCMNNCMSYYGYSKRYCREAVCDFLCHKFGGP
jgi:hypothetical protein